MVGDGIGSQPSTGVVLVRVGVVFRAEVNFADRIREEISSPDDLSTDDDILTKVPSEGCAGEGESLGFPGAGFEDRQFVFPRREGDGAQLVVGGCKGDRVAKVAGEQVFDFLLALLSPLSVNGEIYERPTRFFFM